MRRKPQAEIAFGNQMEKKIDYQMETELLQRLPWIVMQGPESSKKIEYYATVVYSRILTHGTPPNRYTLTTFPKEPYLHPTNSFMEA